MNYNIQKSAYYEYSSTFERFGNYVIPTGQEMFLPITDREIHGIDSSRYVISNRLRIFDYLKREYVSPRGTSYLVVGLHNSMKNKMVDYLLHRIYMMVFCYIPGCENMEVNHIDGNKANPAPYNLEWTTHRENINHAIMTGLLPQKLTTDQIIEIIELYNAGNTVSSIANKFNISTGYVSDIVRGRRTGRKQSRIEQIKEIVPVTREKFEGKISDELIKEISERYNNGEEYYELAKEYNIDRSWLTKSIKKYAESHPEIQLRKLKKMTPEMAETVCKLFEMNKGVYDKSKLYNLVLNAIGLENNPENRKAISNLYNGKTYKAISSKYNYQ